MKKIINNLVYDTNTAKDVGEWSNGYSVSDFKHVYETLYRKRTGEYFLHGQGGPMSKYAVKTGSNSWSGGEKIIPLEYESARKWAEDKLDADDYIAEFGDPGEGDNDQEQALCLRIPVSLHARLKKKQAQTGLTINDLGIKALERYLAD